jgi:hypothetical protein
MEKSKVVDVQMVDHNGCCFNWFSKACSNSLISLSIAGVCGVFGRPRFS